MSNTRATLTELNHTPNGDGRDISYWLAKEDLAEHCVCWKLTLGLPELSQMQGHGRT